MVATSVVEKMTQTTAGFAVLAGLAETRLWLVAGSSLGSAKCIVAQVELSQTKKEASGLVAKATACLAETGRARIVGDDRNSVVEVLLPNLEIFGG